MKVIDLLSINKKEMPKFVKHYSGIYDWDKEKGDFFKGSGEGLLQWCVSTFDIQNHFIDEVEIIEEDKKIGKVDVNHLQQIKKWKRAKVLGNKINEIIDKINSMEVK